MSMVDIAVTRELIRALEGLIRRVEREECRHEETHRGGAIWTICEGCGQEWADDRGGFKPYEDPAEMVRARAALAEAEKAGY